MSAARIKLSGSPTPFCAVHATRLQRSAAIFRRSEVFATRPQRVQQRQQSRVILHAAQPSAGGGPTDGGASGGSGSKGSGGSGGSGDKKKPASSGGVPHPLRAWTFLYATILAAGGIMGYVKAGSYKSLAAGVSASIILAVCAIQMGGGPATRSAAIVATVIAAALAGVMGVRYSKSGKFMPAGLAATLSGGTVLAFLVSGY